MKENIVPAIRENFDGISARELGDTTTDVNIEFIYETVYNLLGPRNSSPCNVSSVTRGQNEQDMKNF
jgi:hypothetical protein